MGEADHILLQASDNREKKSKEPEQLQITISKRKGESKGKKNVTGFLLLMSVPSCATVRLCSLEMKSMAQKWKTNHLFSLVKSRFSTPT